MCPCSCSWLEDRIVQGGNVVSHIWETHFPCCSVKQVILIVTVEVYMLPISPYQTITVAQLNPRLGQGNQVFRRQHVHALRTLPLGERCSINQTRLLFCSVKAILVQVIGKKLFLTKFDLQIKTQLLK